MELRTFTTFEADFLDDAKFAKNGDVERPGGRNITLVLCEMLRRRGLKVSDPEQHSFYGWTFLVSDDDLTLWFLLQFPGPWLLLSQNRSSLVRKLFGSKSLLQHRRILEMLNDSLAQDARFRDIRWFTKKMFEKGRNRTNGDKTP